MIINRRAGRAITKIVLMALCLAPMGFSKNFISSETARIFGASVRPRPAARQDVRDLAEQSIQVERPPSSQTPNPEQSSGQSPAQSPPQSPAQSEKADGQDAKPAASSTAPQAEGENPAKPKRRQTQNVPQGAENPAAPSTPTPVPSPVTAPTAAATTGPAGGASETFSSSGPTGETTDAGALLTLPVVLGLFAVTFLALILTVMMLRKHLRKISGPAS
jgi:hypothetical protein